MFSITIYLVTVHGAEFGDFLFCNPFSSVWKNKKTKNSISYRQTRVRIYRPPPLPPENPNLRNERTKRYGGKIIQKYILRLQSTYFHYGLFLLNREITSDVFVCHSSAMYCELTVAH